MQNIIRFARKYNAPIASSFGLPDWEYLKAPDAIKSVDPATATT